MLHHVSFATDDPMRTAGFLAQLVDGHIGRFGPVADAAVVWAGDGAGTAFELYPRGTELWPDPAGGPAHFGRNELAQPATATHASISVRRPASEVLALADEAGWQATTTDRGGFDVIELWIDNRILLEVMTPVMLTDYLRSVNAPQIAARGTEFEPLVLSVRVGLPTSQAWAAWTDPERLQLWWGMASARVDLRVGGAFEMIFLPDAPAGHRGSEQCRVLSYVPDRMLSFTWNTPAHLPIPSTHTWVVVTFTPVGEGTEIELVHNGLLSGPGWDECREYFRHAWRRVLHRLAEHAAPVDLTEAPGAGSQVESASSAPRS